MPGQHRCRSVGPADLGFTSGCAGSGGRPLQEGFCKRLGSQGHEQKEWHLAVPRDPAVSPAARAILLPAIQRTALFHVELAICSVCVCVWCPWVFVMCLHSCLCALSAVPALVRRFLHICFCVCACVFSGARSYGAGKSANIAFHVELPSAVCLCVCVLCSWVFVMCLHWCLCALSAVPALVESLAQLPLSVLSGTRSYDADKPAVTAFHVSLPSAMCVSGAPGCSSCACTVACLCLERYPLLLRVSHSCLCASPAVPALMVLASQRTSLFMLSLAICSVCVSV